MKPHLLIVLHSLLLVHADQWRSDGTPQLERLAKVRRDTNFYRDGRQLEAPDHAAQRQDHSDQSRSADHWRNHRSESSADHWRDHRSGSSADHWRDHRSGSSADDHWRDHRSESSADDRSGSSADHRSDHHSEWRPEGIPQLERLAKVTRDTDFYRDGRQLERLAKVTRDTDVRVVEWNSAVTDNVNEVTGRGDTPAYSLYPSRREQSARKKKKPAVQAVQPSSTAKVEEKATERYTNRYQEQISTKTAATTQTTTSDGETTPKPTKYHYYPHNQHIYLLPECAIQQVCNAVYVRLNYTQPLCACPSRKEPCSASLNTDDLHTTELAAQKTGKVFTLVKTCEPVSEMRVCRAPRDWSLLALQNIRTGKSHYLVICRCPDNSKLEGPMSHDQPAYASVPGIRVYGMMCVRHNYRKPPRNRRSLTERRPPLPWEKIREFKESVDW